jgi:transposase
VVKSSAVQTEGLSRNCAVALGRIERGTDTQDSDAIEMGRSVSLGIAGSSVSYVASISPSRMKASGVRTSAPLIADNLSAHKTKRVAQFLADHPKVHLHFTPTYSSWLNQVELWFGRIERDVVARGVFTSVNDLARKLMRYIRHHNQHAAPIKWAYRDFSHRIIATSDSAVTGH